MSSVKYFHSAMNGAPVLSGTAGSLIGVLDACLVNGFGLTTVDSILVASGVATANMSLGHSFEPDTTALIAGSSTTALNGEKTVLTSTTNTITFSAQGVADGTYTGAGVTAKLAPAGWEKPFSGANLAAYRSADITSTRTFLRVDDTGTVDARVVGYETLTDVNTGTGPFPTSTQMSGGCYWPKANAANATARAWTVVADGKTFWYWCNTHTTSASFGLNGFTAGFGDFVSYKAGDAYGCVLSAHNASLGASTSDQVGSVTFADQTFVGTTAGAFFFPRSYTGVGSSMGGMRRVEAYANANVHSGTTNTAATYPNGPNNGLLLTRYTVHEPSPLALRGVLRGPLFVAQSLGATNFAWRDKITGQGNLNGRKLMALKGSAPASTTATSQTLFIDITGPWE